MAEADTKSAAELETKLEDRKKSSAIATKPKVKKGTVKVMEPDSFEPEVR